MIRDGFSLPSPFISCYINPDSPHRSLSQAWYASETPSQMGSKQQISLANNDVVAGVGGAQSSLVHFQELRQRGIVRIQRIIIDLAGYDSQIKDVKRLIIKIKESKSSISECAKKIASLRFSHVLCLSSAKCSCLHVIRKLQTGLNRESAEIQSKIEVSNILLSNIEKAKRVLVKEYECVLANIQENDGSVEKLQPGNL